MRYQLRVFLKNCAVVLGIVLSLAVLYALLAVAIFLTTKYPWAFLPTLVLIFAAILATIFTLDNPFGFR